MLVGAGVAPHPRVQPLGLDEHEVEERVAGEGAEGGVVGAVAEEVGVGGDRGDLQLGGVGPRGAIVDAKVFRNLIGLVYRDILIYFFISYQINKGLIP